MRHLFISIISIALLTSCIPKPAASGSAGWIIEIDSQKISTEEFLHMLTKNQSDSSLTRKEIDDYLELYTNFKLKVLEARAEGYDTVKALKSEFEMYRSQLLRPYMDLDHLDDSLVAEAYKRSLSELRAQHILIQSENKKEAEVLKEIIEIRNRALAGESFTDLAKRYSEDPSARVNGGDLGYFSAFRMVYPFEIAAYSTEVGGISKPVKTRFGYHIIKVTDKRPVRDQLKLAHILIRNSQDPLQAEQRIENVYEKLQNGENWDDVCRLYSEDPNSKNNGGELPWISAGRTVPEFENAAYQLSQPGQISKPIQTPYGWHIIKLIDRKGPPSFEEAQPEIEQKLKRIGGQDLTENEIINRLKDRYEFVQNDSIVFNFFVEQNTEADGWLFKVDGKEYSIEDFEIYLKNENLPSTIASYESYISQSVLDREALRITSGNPEVKYLIQEYDEGLLLFEIMDDKVWKKAIEDSVGLVQYYEDNQEKYLWDERFSVARFEGEINSQLLEVKSAEDWPLDSMEVYAEENELIFTHRLYETGEDQIVDSLDKNIRLHFVDDHTAFLIIARIDPANKSLEETKGQVISDYQDYIDQVWIEKLRSEHKVVINEKELEKIYQNSN